MESQIPVINKMEKLTNFIEHLNKVLGKTLDFSYDKTAYEIMHAQTRYSLDTLNDVSLLSVLYNLVVEFE